MRDRITINFFSNICEIDPERDALFKTATSLGNWLGSPNYNINVFVHPTPFARAFSRYKDAVEDFFPHWFRPRVIRTKGLADGYKRSILEAETPYLFQIEHDWLFRSDLIRHSLGEILNAMEAYEADYFRLGKEPNRTNKYGHKFYEVELGRIPACSVKWRSNNPHIIDVKAYRREYLDHIRTDLGGSSGIEECLPEAAGAYVYGPINYPPTIEHINGRYCLRQFEKRVGKFTYRLLNKTGLLEPEFRALCPSSPQTPS